MPAIAPPLIDVMFIGAMVGEAVAIANGELVELVEIGLVLEDKVVVALCPKGVTNEWFEVVVVRTVLLYPIYPAHPYPCDPEAYLYVA